MNGRPGGKIVGVGRALGSRVVTNRDLEATLDTTEDWISTRTGISERRFVGEDEDCSTLAIEASKKALEHAGVAGDSVDLIVCATSTAPESMPSVACLVGEGIGPLASAPWTWRLPAPASPTRPLWPTPCSQAAPPAVLLIGADAMSTIVDQKDRSTAVLFGDGAGAVVLDASEDSSVSSTTSSAPTAHGFLGRAGHPGDENKLYQNGREVFKFAVRILPEMFEKLLARNSISPEEVQYIIPHQANARIIQAAARKMAVPEEKIVVNLDRFGNTSAASIPLSYPDIYEKLEPGRYVVTVGFGFGLTWAANLYRI